jgi:hypothetical protein
MTDERGPDEEAQNATPVETVEGGEENEPQAEKGEEGEAQAETEGETSAVSITDEQWKGMATVIRAIYDFREDEYGGFYPYSQCATANLVPSSVAMTLPGSSNAWSTNVTSLNTSSSSRSPWL